ncbi:uncharacterized protein LOC111250718 isoform X1 [Varroa destructor]|uniref:Mitochondrial assembly of ribosomal large subunit protein 1 n=1 Tax=Varroa destructor TaxID=109461 RepID=A0A7M7KE95_VARDE|nr:uncharacterized protein LOC111250718 isoform X1 [Varroa destructor]
MAALRSALMTMSSRGATAFRPGSADGIRRSVQADFTNRVSTCLGHRCIHRAVTRLQPTKVPMTDEERKLLEKLGEPDHETRGYLNELYDEFDVGAEKRKEQRQQRKQKKDHSKDKQSDEDAAPKSFVAPAHIAEKRELSTMSFIRSLHTSRILKDRAPSIGSSDGNSKSSSDIGAENDSEVSDNHVTMKPSIKVHKQRLTDETEIIWDHQEKLDAQHTYNDYYPEQQKVDLLRVGIKLPRGETGVFDIDDLVSVLREERLLDVVVIKIPPNLPYADYLVICSAISVRQAKAITQYLRKMFKRKKRADDAALKIEGMDSDDWKVLDMGNIVLHIFDQQTREKYDLETLWTVGADMDDLVRDNGEQEDVDTLEKHMSFVRSLIPQHATTSTDSP